MFCYVVLSVITNFAFNLIREEIVGCSTYLSSLYLVNVSIILLFLTEGAAGWSAVCDCGISRSHTLPFLLLSLRADLPLYN